MSVDDQDESGCFELGGQVEFIATLAGHIIRLQDGTECLEVVRGNEVFEVSTLNVRTVGSIEDAYDFKFVDFPSATKEQSPAEDED